MHLSTINVVLDKRNDCVNDYDSDASNHDDYSDYDTHKEE
jgi:hypothetical protein